MAKFPDDDLFKDTRMSFGSHLEELRMALFRAIVGLVIGVLLGFWAAEHVVSFIEGPLVTALEEYYEDSAKIRLREEAGLKDVAIDAETLNTIIHAGYIPTVNKVEPRAVLEALRAADPAGFPEVKYEPYRFVRDDLPPDQVQPLAKKLHTAGQAVRSTGLKAIWDAMTAGAQKQVSSIAAGDLLASEAERDEVIAALNHVAGETRLYEAEEFKESILDSEAKELEDHLRAGLDEKFDPLQARRLNRTLISASLHEHLRPPTLQLVDIPIWRKTEVRLQGLSAQEAFMIWMKAAMITGLIISAPWIFWQVWQFVAAGLYPHEKKYVAIYLPFSLALFLAGAALAFFFVFQPVLAFLFSFNRSMNIDPDPRIGEWISFVLTLPLGFGIAFQLPLVMLFVNRIGIISVETYLQKWRIAILAIFVISMVLTPADPISMLLMAVPLTFLYFLGIGMCQWMPRGRNPFTEVYEP